MTTAILQLGHPTLRLIAEPITDWHSANIQSAIQVLHESLANTEGVGIAAPQIGLSLRLIIIASRPNKRYPHAPLMTPTLMLNPEYHALTTETIKDWEGCLSIPQIRALVPRYTKIQLNYQNEQGENNSVVLTDFVARIAQHEIDHLNGLVYLDRVENNSDIISEIEYFKQIVH